MANALESPLSETALLLVDSLNEFRKLGGKLCEMTKGSAEAAGIPIVYANHHANREGVYHGWKHPAPAHVGVQRLGAFEAGSSGIQVIDDVATQTGDVIAQEHWTSSGFANTDLEFLLNKHGIEQVLLAGSQDN